MRRKVKFLTLILGVVLALSLAFSAAACNSSNEDEEEDNYYISLASESSPTFSKKSDVTSGELFTKSGSEYTLTIDLAQGDSFTINKVGSDVKFGYSSVWSASTVLTEGTSDAISVGASASYTLTLSPSDSTISYSYVPVLTGITVSAADTTIIVGQSTMFSAVLSYSDGTTVNGSTSTVTWTATSNANVDTSGRVTGIAAGTATITATSKDNTSVSGSKDITINAAPEESGGTTGGTSSSSVTGIKLNHTSYSLELDETLQLEATLEPDDAEDTVTWMSDNESVATVGMTTGLVTAVSFGTATITAQCGSVTATCVVTVSRPVTDISIDATLSVNVGSTKTLTVDITPSNATNQDYTVTLSGSDTSIVEVSQSGLTISVEGKAVGTVSLIVTSDDNPTLSSTCTITVNASGTADYYLNETSATVMIEDNETLTVTAENDTITNISWTSSKTGVATVTGSDFTSGSTTASATVTGVMFGMTTITASITTANNGTKTLTCDVLVADTFFYIYGNKLDNGDWWTYSSADDAAADGVAFTETGTGTYELTVHLSSDASFQLIFPNAGIYTDNGGNWTISMPAYAYYDSSRSDSEYIADYSTNFQVTQSGTYKITLDLTTDTSYTSEGYYGSVYITLVSLDFYDVTVSGDSQLQIADGDTSATANLTFSYEPSSQSITEDDFSVTFSDEYTDIISVTYDLTAKTITVTLNENPTEDFDLVLTVTIGTATPYTYTISVLVTGEETTGVTSVTFTQDGVYYLDVTNSDGDSWTTTVSASVDADATVKGITYSIVDGSDYCSIDQDGNFSATALGTFTIRATANGDNTKYKDATVTVYSQYIYLNGVITSAGLTWSNDALEPQNDWSSTFDGVLFTASEDHQTYTLVIELSTSDVFQIVYLGMDSMWNRAIINSADSKNFSVSSNGTYLITLDLSGATPVVSFDSSIVAAIDITFDKSTTVMGTSSSYTFEALVTFSDGDTSTTGVVYTSSNDSIISINSSTGVATSYTTEDEVTITATYTDTYGTHSVEITVLVSDTEKAEATAELSGTTELNFPTISTTLTLSVTAGTADSVEWTSSNSAVTVSGSNTSATVSAEIGTFGYAKITAEVTLENGDKIYAYADVYYTASFFYIAGANDSWEIYDKDWAESEGVLLNETEDDSHVFSRTIHIDLDSTEYGVTIYFGGIETEVGSGNYPYYAYEISGYDATTSDTDYVTNASGTNSARFTVKESGYYTITLDLTGDSPKVTVTKSSIDVEDVKLTTDNATQTIDANTTTSITYSIGLTPDDADYDTANVSAALSSETTGYGNYVECSLDTTKMQVTVTCTNDPDTSFSVTLTVTVEGVKGTATITVSSSTGGTVEVDSIAFNLEDNATQYYYDVNNGGNDWTTTVSASVSSNSGETPTNTAISFTANPDDITLSNNGDGTCDVTSKSLGTFEITATAEGNKEKTKTVEITFYSDTFFILGDVNSWDYPAASVTSLNGTAFESYQFTDDGTHKTFTFTLSGEANSTGWDEWSWSTGVIICYLGASGWDTALTGSYVDSTSSSSSKYWTEGGNMTNSSGAKFTVDLSGTSPKIIIT